MTGAGIVNGLVALCFSLMSAVASASDWSDFGNGYANQRFSPLDQIDRGSVSKLVPAWIFQSGTIGPIQAQPAVVDGALVLTLPGNEVVKIDGATGELLWRYRHIPRNDNPRNRGTNRGATVRDGTVYHATNDGRLIALGLETGTVVWDRMIAVPLPEELASLSPEKGEALTESVGSLAAKMAPVAFDDMVVVGTTFAGYGIYYNLGSGVREGRPPGLDAFRGKRGFLAAFDAKTGAERWRWYTTKQESWEGTFSATTPDGFTLPRNTEAERESAPTLRDANLRGGSSTWMTPAYDGKLGLLFVGTGNASPNDVPSLRPGDNLYANSLVALDAETGEVRWHYQQVPQDVWGYDVASAPVLFEVTRDDARIDAVGVAGKTGWFYAHNRETGELLFKSDPLVPQKQMFSAPTPEGITISPGSFGGASWSPTSYDPRTGWLFVPAIHMPTRFVKRVWEGGGPRREFILTELDEKAQRFGTLSAVDTRGSGRIRWQVKTEEPLIGGVLATAGDLVFMGEADGTFSAFDAGDGKRLWGFFCGAGVNAPPMSYAVDGRQYVAVAASGHPYVGRSKGDALIAFALPR
ncbi:MAG: PQQ-binding-like beta-propeller repeat protein [Myxococcales bacterium]|nr:PQQ-binding-like beta-propeller repeat protein [Myxococcales bacterium]